MAHDHSLKTLHTALIDAAKGYATAYNDAETSEIKAMFQTMMTLHQNAHSDLHKILLRFGETVDEDGSFMSSVHKAVISVRAATVGLDRNSISSFAEGEERIVDYYDKAIADAARDKEAVAILSRQRSSLIGKISEMSGIAA